MPLYVKKIFSTAFVDVVRMSFCCFDSFWWDMRTHSCLYFWTLPWAGLTNADHTEEPSSTNELSCYGTWTCCQNCEVTLHGGLPRSSVMASVSQPQSASVPFSFRLILSVRVTQAANEDQCSELLTLCCWGLWSRHNLIFLSLSWL